MAFQFLFPSVLLSFYHHLKAKNGMYFCPSIFEHFRMVWPSYFSLPTYDSTGHLKKSLEFLLLPIHWREGMLEDDYLNNDCPWVTLCAKEFSSLWLNWSLKKISNFYYCPLIDEKNYQNTASANLFSTSWFNWSF